MSPKEPALFDMVLRDPARLDQLVQDEPRLGATLQGLLGLALLGLVLHGALVGAAAGLARDDLAAWGHLLGAHPAVVLPAALAGAFLTALCVCLPSFYFFTQLSGLDASFRLITAQAVRVLARTAVLLLGILPFYAACALSRSTGVGLSAGAILWVGLALPFAVGLLGIASLYRSFRALLGVLPMTHTRRGDFLLRMVLAWGAVFSAVAPVALYRYAEALARVL